MALPLYLAMTASEMSSIPPIPANFAYMACHFSPYSQGLSNLPSSLPPGSILILNDNFPCQGHSPGLVADQLKETADTFLCESILLDFQRPPCAETEQLITSIVSTISVPVVISSGHGKNRNGPVFLPPCPLHIPLAEYLAPWKNREIWLEAALCQEEVTVSKEGATFTSQFPPHGLDGGFYDEELCCNYRICKDKKSITFTLFDTPDSLNKKLSRAHFLGVSHSVGLWQELGNVPPQKR